MQGIKKSKKDSFGYNLCANAEAGAEGSTMEAMNEAISRGHKRPKEEEEKEPKVPKAPKLSTQDMREKKIRADILAALASRQI